MLSEGILVFAGKKQAGKNTCANFVQGLKLEDRFLIDRFEVSDRTNGKLLVWHEGKEFIYDTSLIGTDDRVKNLCMESNFFASQRAFADPIKEMCVETFGFRPEQCYGTNEDKNTLTEYRWEDMPGLSATQYRHRTGSLTAREMMKYVGTQLFRKMNPDIWANKLFNNLIKNRMDNPYFCLITDSRFPNEVRVAHKHGAKVIRLTRTIDPHDRDESEIALDQDRFDYKEFDLVIDNENMSLSQTLLTLFHYLKDIQWIANDRPVPSFIKL